MAAFHVALEVFTHERVPFYWAISFGCQGLVKMSIAERKGDLELAQTALEQINIGHETLRSAGHGSVTAYYASQIPKARAIMERLLRSNF